MFGPCRNYGCPRAGWCKRVSYPFTEEERQSLSAFFECGDYNGWKDYVRNKAREIYERENPDDAFRNDEFEQEEHPNNNRESRMREDDEADNGITIVGRGRHTIIPDSSLQLLRSGNRRSEHQSIVEIMRDLQETHERLQERTDVFQDITRDGFSSVGPISTEPDDSPAITPFRNPDIYAGIRRTEAPGWYVLSDIER